MNSRLLGSPSAADLYLWSTALSVSDHFIYPLTSALRPTSRLTSRLPLALINWGSPRSF
jgi:hypothetical protein